jgi:Rad3-related DNA helicase
MSMTKPQEEAEKLAEHLATQQKLALVLFHKAAGLVSVMPCDYVETEKQRILREIQPLLTRIEELEAQLKDARIYGAEKDHTATVFMNQIRHLQKEAEHLPELNAVAKAALLMAATLENIGYYEGVVTGDKIKEAVDKYKEALTPLRESGWRPTE